MTRHDITGGLGIGPRTSLDLTAQKAHVALRVQASSRLLHIHAGKWKAGGWGWQLYSDRYSVAFPRVSCRLPVLEWVLRQLHAEQNSEPPLEFYP